MKGHRLNPKLRAPQMAKAVRAAAEAEGLAFFDVRPSPAARRQLRKVVDLLDLDPTLEVDVADNPGLTLLRVRKVGATMTSGELAAYDVGHLAGSRPPWTSDA